jgi:cardiolipin synthase
MFLDMWILMTGEPLIYNNYRPTISAIDDGFVQPFNDSPFSGNVSEGAYMQLINSSCRYLYIMTPYLILDHEMTITLCNAAHGGIDVRIITPHIPDKKYVHIVTRGYYGQLIECGIKIYEYIPGFLHAKMALCDDETGIIGSVNMDYRSFYLQFEDAVWLCGCKALKDMKKDFDETFAKSKLIDLAQWKKRPLKEKMAEIILRLFAPLM